MANQVTFTHGAKRTRGELRLPQLHFIAMDDWSEKLGEKAFVAWLKFYTYADRSNQQEDQDGDLLKNSLTGIAKRLGVSKETFFQKILPTLWNYGLIDVEDKGMYCNIIVYEYPQNDPSLATKPLLKVRDYETEWTSKNRENAKKGGRDREQTRSDREIHSSGSEIEPVSGSEIEPVSGSEIEPNNVLKSTNVSKMYVRMRRADRAAIQSKDSTNSLYQNLTEDEVKIIEALDRHAGGIILQGSITMAGSEYYIPEIYAMLQKSFPAQLDPKVVEIAARLYEEKRYDMQTLNPKFEISNPVGWFYDAYKDAIHIWKAQRHREHRTA